MNNYLSAGFEHLKNATVKIGGTDWDCILDMQNYSLKRNYGFEEDDTCTILVSSLATIQIGDLVEIDNKQWIVQRIGKGAAYSNLTLVSKNA